MEKLVVVTISKEIMDAEIICFLLMNNSSVFLTFSNLLKATHEKRVKNQKKSMLK